MASKAQGIPLEDALQRHFGTPSADPAFLLRLRSDLPRRVSLTAQAARRTRTVRPAWLWYVLGALVILLVATIAALGPGRVLAQLEHWIGYAPGLGEVNLSGTRALATPVSQQENGVSFSIVEFVAAPDETLVMIRISGLPKGLHVSPTTPSIVWPGGHGLRMRSEQWGPSYPPCEGGDCQGVREPDGYVFQVRYEALPADVDNVELVWLPWGVVPGSSPSDEWRVKVHLGLVSAENQQGLAGLSYVPQGASDIHYGVRLVVDRVFGGSMWTIIDTETILAGDGDFPSPSGVSLITNEGRSYEPVWDIPDLDENPVQVGATPPSMPGAPVSTSWPMRWHFGPVDPKATRLSLTVDNIRVSYPVEASFALTLGPHPKSGDVIPLDVAFIVNGIPIHINRAQIVNTQITSAPDNKVREVEALQFQVDSPVETDGRKLLAIYFSPHYYQGHADPFVDHRTGVLTDRLTWDSSLVQGGAMIISLDRVELDLHGPWVASWDVPSDNRGTTK